MKYQYVSAFIIPIGAKKNLTDVGWIFESENFVPGFVLDYLVGNLKLYVSECYLGIKKLIHDDIQANVIVNDKDQIESVYIQFHENRLNFIVSEFNKTNLNAYTELFIPVLR